MIVRGTREWPVEGGDFFDRAQAFTTTPGMNGWTIADTSSSGTPTYLCVTEDGGAAQLTLASTSEAEIVTLYQNDVLPWDLASLQHVEFIAKVSGIDSATTLTFGVGSARNDTADSVTVNAWFRMEGSASTSAVVVETDDNVTDNNDVATGATLGSGYKKFTIDFTNGLSDVRFYIDGQRVAAGTTFTMAAVTSGQNVQPIIQLQKASGTGTPSITIANVRAQYNYSYGA
jgi:hypothetical protein